MVGGNEAVPTRSSNGVDAVVVAFKINDIVECIHRDVDEQSARESADPVVEPEVIHSSSDDIISNMRVVS